MNYQSRRKLQEHLFDLLCKWQKERPQHPGFVPWGEDTVPAWHKFEMESLLTEVNSQRASWGALPVSMIGLRRVETGACGHSDYTQKLSLYAAEMVFA